MPRSLRVCIVYDCLYPFTVGGHERWLRLLAESLAAQGHRVTFLTRLQWDAAEPPDVPGVEVLAVSPCEELYGADGGRRTLPPLRFGLGVGRHLARHRDSYDVVHTCSFPYFHLPALRLALAGSGVPVTVDWPEVWSKRYWRSYSGLVGGTIGIAVQALCVRLTPQAVVFSRTHGDRLAALGLKRRPERPGGLGPDPSTADPQLQPGSGVLFAGRLIREKRAPLVVAAVAVARKTLPALSATILGEGPEKAELLQAVSGKDWASAPGFVARERVEEELRNAAVLLAPSEREGFGIVVLEAAAVGTPVVVVAGPDNAATELIEPGVNGFVAADASPASVAAALVNAVAGAGPLRESTAQWYSREAARLSMTHTARAMEQLFLASVEEAVG